MKKFLLFLWLCLPVAAVAFHFGPGQQLLAEDRAGAELGKLTGAAGEDWQRAVAALEEARSQLSKGIDTKKLPTVEQRRLQLRDLQLQLEIARRKLGGGKVLEAQNSLESLLDQAKELSQGKSHQAQAKSLVLEARNETARAAYFAAWLMRLEGATRDEWNPEAEQARQQFRLLAESTDAKDAPQLRQRMQQNLEATVQLQQLTLTDLQALPLPKDCPCNCSSLSQRKRKQRLARSKKKKEKKGKGKDKKDARKKVQKAAGAGVSKRKGSGS